MSQELRKLLTSQQADDNETSAWSVSIYLSLIYSSFWRGLTALSILCDVGNAKAFGSRMGRRTAPTPFLYTKENKRNKELLTFGVLIG